MLELHRLLSDLLDGQLSEDGQRALAEMLRDNPEAQELYCNFMSLHALMHLDLSDGGFQLLPPLAKTTPVEHELPAHSNSPDASGPSSAGSTSIQQMRYQA